MIYLYHKGSITTAGPKIDCSDSEILHGMLHVNNVIVRSYVQYVYIYVCMHAI